MLLATFFVACFGYIFLTSPSVSAADATWNADNITFEGNTYSPTQTSATLPADIPDGAASYQFTDTSKNPNIAHFIFFTASVDNPKSAKEATYIRYTLNPPPNQYINPTGEKKISLTPSEPTAAPDTDESVFSSGCTISGIGYIVCPLMNGIAEGMDFIYERIRGFLVVQPLSTSTDNPVYRIWMYSRDLANIAFVIGFLVIIYSYLVGGGFSGYEIRKIIPRVIVAAVLINISYILCAAAVDISNIAGYGVNQLFEDVRDNVLAGSSVDTKAVNWTSVTSWVLAGSAGGIAGTGILIGAIAGAATGLWFLLAPFLLGAALLVMVTFLILAARQAILVLAIAIAPLAFAAYILPNTEKWFERWRTVFVNMLVMFPAFGAVFGGSQLAGELIIRTAADNGSIEQIILGLGVMVAPLAITPLLLKLGGGLMNRIGGIVNNSQKGLYDRYKNHNQERLADHVAKNSALNARLRANGGFRRGQLMRRRAAYDHAKKNYRENQRKLNDEAADNSWHRQTGRWGYSNNSGYGTQRSRITARARDGFGNLDTYKRDNQLQHNQTEAHHEEHWQNKVYGDPTRRGMQTDTRLSENRAKVTSGRMEAQDERTFQTALNAGAGIYGGLRTQKVDTSVDTGIGDIQKAAVEAAGKLALSTTVSNDRALRSMKVETFTVEKQAETIDNTLQKNAEANWDYLSRTDDGIRNLRLKETRATDSAKLVQDQWNTLIENIRTNGATAPGLAIADGNAANSIMKATRGSEIEQKAQDAAKLERSEKLAKAFEASYEAQSDPTKGDATLLVRAGGIGGQRAQTRIYAKAKADVVNAAVEEVKTNRSLTSEMTRFQLHKLMREGEMPDGQHATVEMQQAAMYALLQEKGNNQDANEIRDAVSKMGMMVDDDGNYFEALRDGNGRIIPGANGFAQLDRSKPIADKTEITRRRDWQQFFDDAAKGTPHSMVTYSGTNKSEARAGTMVDDIRGGFLRDATMGKFSPDKLLKADVDELKTLLEDVSSPSGYYASLSQDKKNQVNDTLESAILRLQGNENINAGIDDRNRGAMNDILATINPAAYTPQIVNGQRLYPVDENKAILPPTERTGNDATFRAPVDVPGVHRPGNYYTDWNVDLQL